MNHTSKFLLFLVASLMWVACHADCYISPTGLDAGNCTSTSPCNSIHYCLELNTGDVGISLMDGSYTNVLNCGITVSKLTYPSLTSLIIQGLPNNTVVINCGDNPGFAFQNINATFTLNSIALVQGRNETGNGGCLYVSNVQGLTVQNVRFSNCVAANGGAIYTDSPTSIMDSTFTFNSVTMDGNGGAIFVETLNLNSTTFSMSKSVLSNNSAVQGGAVFINGDYASITDSNITFNDATTIGYGGGVYLSTSRPGYVGDYNFLGTTVCNNTAEFGGGLYNFNLNHTFNVFGALFTNNSAAGSALSASEDPNIYCASNTSLFCYSCAATDCQSGCAAGSNQSCSLNAASKAFCYSTKFTTCVGNSCTCAVAKSGLPTAAKIVISLIAACLLIGIFLILIDVIRHFRQKKQGYTPINGN